MQGWRNFLRRISVVAAAAAASLTTPPLYAAPAEGEYRLDTYAWQTAGGGYIDPTSFFAVHGYVDAVFAGASPDWTTPDPAQIGPPGQVLIPNTDRMSFGVDAALFVSSEISERTRMMLELHLVADPSGQGAAGPGGLTIVLTEATASWDLWRRHLTLSGGLFWVPFGTVNRDWLGAQNAFATVPRAAAALPAHWNERGVRLDGSVELAEDWGLNYVASFGNGVQGFDITGQTPVDLNHDKTVAGRVGLFPGLGRQLEVGLSGAYGELRERSDPFAAPADPRGYGADFYAVGADGAWRWQAWRARSYLIHSVERLDATPAEIQRLGWMAELAYRWEVETELFGLEAIVPKARFDWLATETLTGAGTTTADAGAHVASVGLSFHPHPNVFLGTEYHWSFERHTPELDNDRFVARLVAQF